MDEDQNPDSPLVPTYLSIDPYTRSGLAQLPSHEPGNFQTLISQALGWIDPEQEHYAKWRREHGGAGGGQIRGDQRNRGLHTRRGSTTPRRQDMNNNGHRNDYESSSEPPTPHAQTSPARFPLPIAGSPARNVASSLVRKSVYEDMAMSTEWLPDSDAEGFRSQEPEIPWVTAIDDGLRTPTPRPDRDPFTPAGGPESASITPMSSSGYSFISHPEDFEKGFAASPPPSMGGATPKMSAMTGMTIAGAKGLKGFALDLEEGFLGWSDPEGTAHTNSVTEAGEQQQEKEQEQEQDEDCEEDEADTVTLGAPVLPVTLVTSSPQPPTSLNNPHIQSTATHSLKSRTPSPVGPPPPPPVPVPSPASADPAWIQHVTLALAVLASQHARPPLIVLDGADLLFERRGGSGKSRRVDTRDGVWDNIGEVFEWLAGVERRGWCELVIGTTGNGGAQHGGQDGQQSVDAGVVEGLRSLRVFDRRLHVRSVDYDSDEAVQAYLLEHVNNVIDDPGKRFEERSAKVWAEYFGGNVDELETYIKGSFGGVEDYIQTRTSQTLSYITEFLSNHPFFASPNPLTPSYLPDLTALVLHLIVNNGVIDPATENWGTRMWELVNVLVGWRVIRRRAKGDDRGSTASTRSRASNKSGGWWARGRAAAVGASSGAGPTDLRGKSSALGPGPVVGVADPFKPLPPHLFDAWNPAGSLVLDEPAFLAGASPSGGFNSVGVSVSFADDANEGGNLSDEGEGGSSDGGVEEDEEDEDEDVDWGEVELVWYDALMRECMERWFNTVGISGSTYNPMAAERLL
ncbi:hypothetical protein HDU93_000170, partial [Gonapodya sp. JEL0774]